MALPAKPWMSVTEAAEKIGITDGRVRQLLGSGVIRGQKINSRAWAVETSSVQEFMKAPRAPGPARIGDSKKKS
jgi:excisionase family DNA binding protein